MSLTLAVSSKQTVLLSNHGLNHGLETKHGKKNKVKKIIFVFKVESPQVWREGAVGTKHLKALVAQKEPLRLFLSVIAVTLR